MEGLVILIVIAGELVEPGEIGYHLMVSETVELEALVKFAIFGSRPLFWNVVY